MKNGEYSKEDFEKDHIHVTFITAYRYNCFIFWGVIVANLLLCLRNILNFIIGTYVQEKNIVSVGFSTIWDFRNVS